MLNGFDYVSYLKRHLFIGQIDPWRRHDDGSPVLCLLTTVEQALEECKSWSNQDISRVELVKELQSNSIFVFRSIDEFQKVKQELTFQVDETKLKLKKKITPERRKQLQEQISQINESRKGSIS